MNSAAELDAATGSHPREKGVANLLLMFGPGAIIASLTIGAGELIFSSRAGALFGYKLLWIFGLILLLKWTLVYTSARHWILTGRHPFEVWMGLPGPRGWLPITFMLLAVLAFPIWVCFHAGTLGSFTAWLTGTSGLAGGKGYLLWALGLLLVVLSLSLLGGYTALELAQVIIVALMLFAVLIGLFLIHPSWGEFFLGWIPQPVQYPPWIGQYPGIASRPIWVETATYLGVIGGSAYDYLAYTSYLREKNWTRLSGNKLEALRMMRVDCVASFTAVLIFTAVFVACGAEALRPLGKVPSGGNLLAFQADFVAAIHRNFVPLYYAGAFLTIFGTLYGTIEVAPRIWGEFIRAFEGRENPHPDPLPKGSSFAPAWIRRSALLYASGGAGCILIGMFVFSDGSNPPSLIGLLTPANLFTGVLGCGIICLLNLWTDKGRVHSSLAEESPALRLPAGLRWLNILGGTLFLVAGAKAYWDQAGAWSILVFAGTVAAGLAAAKIWPRSGLARSTPRSGADLP